MLDSILAVLRPQLARLGYAVVESTTATVISSPDGRVVFCYALDERDAELLRAIAGMSSLPGMSSFFAP